MISSAITSGRGLLGSVDIAGEAAETDTHEHRASRNIHARAHEKDSRSFGCPNQE
jgi:hypothetical protein